MPFFMGLRDVGLFVRSARTDARLNQLRSTQGAAAALEAVYAANPDPGPQAHRTIAISVGNMRFLPHDCHPDVSITRSTWLSGLAIAASCSSCGFGAGRRRCAYRHRACPCTACRRAEPGLRNPQYHGVTVISRRPLILS
jgi:hypothetical protein